MHSFLPSLLSLFLYLIPPRSSLAALAAIVSNAPLPSSLLCVSLQERVSQPRTLSFQCLPTKVSTSPVPQAPTAPTQHGRSAFR